MISRGAAMGGEPSPTHTHNSKTQAGMVIEVWDGSTARQTPLEEYLVGVVSAEMPALFEMEALKAQSVAARTFAYRHMLGVDRCKSGYTICTRAECCQAYMGPEELSRYWKEDYAAYYSRISAAVNATAGLIATDDGRPISALYHSNSGGRTEDSGAVFAMTLPYLVSVESLGEDSAPCYRTNKRVSNADFVRILNAEYPRAALSEEGLEEQVSVIDRTRSGRVGSVRIGAETISGSQMRLALGLNSANFDMEFGDGYISFTCLGYGHGVGMSQYGANAMAKEGADFIEILKHYYTGVEVEAIKTRH